MKKCIIICAGDFDISGYNNDSDSTVIVADGGNAYSEKYGIRPDIIIGDFDSLGYTPTGNNVIKLPCEKDLTDSFAAYEYMKSMGYNYYEIYGALGGNRFSHSLANLQLLIKIKEDGFGAEIKDKNCTIRVLKNETVKYNAEYCKISFLAADSGTSVEISGMKYNGKYNLSYSYPLGESNELVGTPAEIKVGNGYVFEIIEE